MTPWNRNPPCFIGCFPSRRTDWRKNEQPFSLPVSAWHGPRIDVARRSGQRQQPIAGFVAKYADQLSYITWQNYSYLERLPERPPPKILAYRLLSWGWSSIRDRRGASMSTTRELTSNVESSIAMVERGTVHLPAANQGPGVPERKRSLSSTEEALVPDARARLRPAQQVENKLRSLLKNAALPVSHVRLATLVNSRCHCG
jgi:hypothetical protein